MYARTLAVVAALFLSGCATIRNGTQQSLEVSSDPPGATVTVGDLHTVTPGTLRLPRRSRHAELRFSKPGYRDTLVRLTRRSSNTLWWNAVAVPVGAAAGAAAGSSSSSGLAVFSSAANGAVVGGLALPVLFFGVDLASGAAYQLEPPRVHATLQPQ